MVNNSLLQKACRDHQVGNLEAASTSYRKILKNLPGQIDALFLLGTLYIQQGDFDSAARFLKKVIALSPSHVAAYNNLGTALQGQGKFKEAIACYNQIISFKPDYNGAHINLGITLGKCGRLSEAVESYRRAIGLNPDHAEAHYNLGNVLGKLEKPDEAIESYKNAIAIRPNYFEAYNNMGTVLKEQSKFNEAVSSYKTAITIKKDYAEAYSNLGAVYQEQDKLDDSIPCYKKSIELMPDNAIVHSNLGSVYMRQGNLEMALDYCRHAISLKPDNAEAHNNLGAIFQINGSLDEAAASYNRAIELKQDYAMAHFNKSLILLLTGNYEEGWSEYEWRLRIKDSVSLCSQSPRWDGSPLDGKRILVNAEQGFGDTIQFVRYLTSVRKKGGYVIFKCQKELLRLLSNCEGFNEIIDLIPTNEQSVKFDTYVPLLSLPGIFGTNIDTLISDVPYISAGSGLVQQWEKRLGHNNNFKIGIGWAGSPKHRYDNNRSCSLTDFTPLANIPNVTFYSLQKGARSNEVSNPPKGMEIVNLENELNDFADTSAVIENMDMVISVDTAVAHLAGAIGKPVWTLLPFAPDWRWLMKRNDSPWYPSMRLFRQNLPGDWSGVFEQVKGPLLEKLNM